MSAMVTTAGGNNNNSQPTSLFLFQTTPASLQFFARISHNDGCAEMLAAIRRGPGAKPTNEEYIEYLLQRKRHDQVRPPFEHHSFEHDRGNVRKDVNSVYHVRHSLIALSSTGSQLPEESSRGEGQLSEARQADAAWVCSRLVGLLMVKQAAPCISLYAFPHNIIPST